jgi:hypothetical protein
MGGSLRDRLARLIADDGDTTRRLAKAHTSVRFQVTNDASASVTLLLDRFPPQLTDDPEAEATLELTADQCERLARGELVLANCLMAESVGHHGQVRKYLSVDAIVRTGLRRLEQAR